jgi:hypothetical protein
MILLVALLSGCSDSKDSGRWHNYSSPLGNVENDTALIWLGDYRLFFQCLSKDAYILEFMTDEAQDFNHRPMLVKDSYIIQARTDRNDVISLSGKSKWTDKNMLWYSIEGPNLIDFLKQIVTAKDKIIIGADSNVSSGRNHVVSFPVYGAHDAMTNTLKSCHII